MLINSKLNYLLDTKNAIKSALKEKGVEVLDTDTFRSYADKIVSIKNSPGGVEQELAIIAVDKEVYTYERGDREIDFASLVKIISNFGETIETTITGNVNFNEVGIYDITYTATDSKGNVATFIIKFTITEKAPKVQYILSTDRDQIKSTMTEGYIFRTSIKVTMDKGFVAEFTRNGKPYEYNATKYLEDGEYMIKVLANDGTYTVRNFIVETSAPAFDGISTVKNKTYTTMPTAIFTAEEFEKVSSIIIKNKTTGESIELNDSKYIVNSEDGTVNIILPKDKLPNGSYEFTVTGKHGISETRTFKLALPDDTVE